MTNQVTVHSAQGVLTITLARPEKKNAITNAMYGAMADAIAGAESNPSMRQHRGDLMLHGKEHPLDVRFDDEVEVFDGLLRGRGGTAADPSIVEGDV